MNGYELSRDWFDFCFENTEKINPNHTALYFFIIEQCNRLGWKEKFGLPMEVAKEAIGISNYRTYAKTFNDLVEWGFIIVHQKSKNQFTANIIAIAKNTIATTKAESKALDKAMQKQSQSIVGIDKPNNNKPNNNKTIEERKKDFIEILAPFVSVYGKDLLNDFFYYWTEHGIDDKKMRFEKEKSYNVERRLATWSKNEKKFNLKNTENGKEKPIRGRVTESVARANIQGWE